MAAQTLVRTDKGLESSFGKEHVQQYAKRACAYCARVGNNEYCKGCGAPLPFYKNESEYEGFVAYQEVLGK